jgi:hypothetical protein
MNSVQNRGNALWISFIPVFKPHTHKLYILGHCSNSFYWIPSASWSGGDLNRSVGAEVTVFDHISERCNIKISYTSTCISKV